jgi:poly(hydroxyalkanoate) depolymerase family esterase
VLRFLAKPRARVLSRVLAVTGAAGLLAGLLVVAQAGSAFATGSFAQVTNFGSNPGKLQMYSYVPSGLPANAPLVLALHGCAQNAADYHNNSGWSKYADMWNFAVVYPQADSTVNPNQCFDWWTPSDDSRGNGQAASIYQMVQYAESTYGVDPHRIYITGLSAGGGMAADLLAAYPDVFAGGSIDSGLPAQCATSQTQAYSCMSSNQNLTPAQWGDLVRNSHSGYTGPWPKVAIWQGTSDTTVYPVNATELREQWTNVWGIGQTASGTQTLPGGTTETDYNSGASPVVSTFSVSGMTHGLAVQPGANANQCGGTGAYYLNYICSSYYTALFWGIGTAGTTSTTSTAPTTTTTPASTTTTTASPCYTANNYDHTVAGRAHQSGGYTYANGSNDAMGLWNTAIVTSLKETSPGYYVVVSTC